MNSSALQGILPVLPTPFNESGVVDYSAMERVAQFCLEAGANALVFPGVASEYDFLERSERDELLEVVCRTAEGKVPVVCGGGKGTPEVISENIGRAQSLGASAAMLLIPAQFSGDVSGALDFVKSVISGTDGVSFVLQNAPTPIGAGLDAKDLLRIVEECPEINYVKEEALPSGPRITEVLASAPNHLTGVIGGGGARYLIDEMNRGAIAAMPAAEITDLHVKMWNAHVGADMTLTRSLYMRSLPLLVIQTIYRMRLTKYVLTERGVLSNSIVRAPLPGFDSYDRAEIAVQLESLSDLFEISRLEESKV
ncbi:dihydrodipicolinate synthase family protein [Pelagicoccus mobilis]|uniref:Dihydrodipicolinate synthase family protein n=1 Tax=Pelagicoccus mobilis TaxID=415221 RepID=A0A934VMK4_9BACT|nr:dihydrodipicolinate synthase family protein [Pelagicoccus mobilis]MBK1878946.1 dihydrodipicolinate synthase family protein [Pelagicoccus mobilis]